MDVLKTSNKLINVRCKHGCRYSHDKNPNVDNNICCFNCIYLRTCNAVCGTYKIGMPPEKCEDNLYV